MSGDSKPEETVQENIAPLSNRRILFVMVFVVIIGTILGFAFSTWKFGLGFLFGGILSFINYYWLKATLKDIFEKVVGGETQQFSAIRFFFRYVMLGVVLGIVFLTGMLPITAVVFGLTSFAFAVLIEAFIRIFSPIFKREEF
jgi:hypothetical protein